MRKSLSQNPEPVSGSLWDGQGETAKRQADAGSQRVKY